MADLRPVVHRMTICLVALAAVVLGLVLADTFFLVRYHPVPAETPLYGTLQCRRSGRERAGAARGEKSSFNRSKFFRPWNCCGRAPPWFRAKRSGIGAIRIACD